MKADALVGSKLIPYAPASTPAPAPKPTSALIPTASYGGFPVLIQPVGTPAAPAPAAPVGGCAGGGCPMMIPPPGGTTTVVRTDGAPAAAAVSGSAWSWETLPWWVWLLVGLVLVALVTR